MHPSLYDDQFGLAYNLRERLSTAKKVLSGGMTPKDKLNQLSGTQRESICSMAQADEDQCDIAPGISLFDHDDKKKVPIGPRFQVDVPEWDDPIYECDTKWLGTRIWPLDHKEHVSLIERDPIGRGRNDSCGCQVPGSITCVQFHISEKRSKVKLELGSAFQLSRFHMMGEGVSTTWKEAEKKTFKTIVESTAPPDCFWDQIYKKFPTKSREVLVSYYYNVFLLQRRAHQNRNAPNDIDSDDEESAWSLPTANDSGGETSKSKSILCTPKKKTSKKSR